MEAIQRKNYIHNGNKKTAANNTKVDNIDFKGFTVF